MDAFEVLEKLSQKIDSLLEERNALRLENERLSADLDAAREALHERDNRLTGAAEKVQALLDKLGSVD